MMGVAFLTLFLSNNIIGWIVRFYEHMSSAPFWVMHAAIAATGGLMILLLGGRLSRAPDVDKVQAIRPSAMTLKVER
jgi:POT family proton-dependent oligopeptide transporter